MKKIIILILITISIFTFNLVNISKKVPNMAINKVIADDDEEEDEEEDHEEDREDEHEDEREDDHEDDYYNNSTNQDTTPTPNINEFVPTNEPKTVTKTIQYKEVLTTTYVQVTEDAYKNDRDGDKLVDAIDPDPDTPQQLFFTDSDGDGVPDAEDKFVGRNDFLYFGNEDLNNNGVVDLYEFY